MGMDRSDGLALQNLLFFIQWMDQKHGIKAITHPKEAIEAAQRGAECGGDRSETTVHLQPVGRSLRTETPRLPGWNPAIRR